jgi:hypothetical protein
VAGRRVLQGDERLPLGVTLDVKGSKVEQGRIIPEETQPVVATLAEQLPDPTGHVVMVEVLGPRIPTDGTPVVLPGA